MLRQKALTTESSAGPTEKYIRESTRPTNCRPTMAHAIKRALFASRYAIEASNQVSHAANTCDAEMDSPNPR